MKNTGIKKALRFILFVLCLYMVKSSYASAGSNNTVAGEELKVNNDCQDMLYLIDGRVIPITYMSETPLKIKFKKCDDPINRTWKKDKIKIKKIVFANGEVTEFNDSNVRSSQKLDKGEKTAIGIVGAVVVGTTVAAVTGGLLLLNWLFSW